MMEERKEDSVFQTSALVCDDQDLDTALDTIDSCVGCVEGIDMQHEFEEGLKQQAMLQRNIAAAHGLSEAEAAMIRLQILGVNSTGIRDIGSQLPGFDVLTNVCGGTDNARGGDDLCPGLVSPTDTTVPAVEAMQRSQLSLMDVAAEEEMINRQTMMVGDNGMNSLVDIAEGSADKQCEICLDISEPISSRRITFCHFPCCVTTSNVCAACILVLTTATTDGTARVGRCPRCRSWIVATTLHSPNAGMAIRALDIRGHCTSCGEEDNILVEPDTCDACFVGKQTPLLYECQECQETQTIPCPLYRHQTTADSFGDKTHECSKCQTSTHWKICESQLTMISAGDIPTEWGDDYLQLARQRVQYARQGIAKLQMFDPNEHAQDDVCLIL
jgi:hypothetical protein